MNKTVAYGGLLAALGLVAGLSIGSRAERRRLEPVEGRLASAEPASGQSGGAGEIARGGDLRSTEIERQLNLLATKLAAETDRRRRLEQQIEGLATELAALRDSGHETLPAVVSKPESGAAAPAVAESSTASNPTSSRDVTTAMERALVAAGIDPTTATEIRRRRDELSLSEIYLRDQATREGWHDSPRFAEEMAEIERQRTSIRDGIGDEAYDRYLAALDQPNRVAVDEVMLDSPAARAGVQAGDVVLRYGDTRIFAPDELVTATRGGTAGETVRMEILRQGQRVQIDVPRGPLGVSIAASRGAPGQS